MPSSDQRSKAEAFRAMHSAGPALLLANVWDVASARTIEDAGFAAVATSSAGIAFSQGYPDGQKMPPDQMIRAIERIASAVALPVTADAEAGYGNRPEDAARTAHDVIQAGAVGMNLEDATGNSDHPLFDLSLQVEKIRAVREAAQRLGIHLVVNARTDIYLLEIGEPAKRYEQALRRLAAFRDAGADCVFAPGLTERPTIGRFVRDLKCPLNILAVPGSPTVSELTALGVSRISLGSGPMRATLGLLRRLAAELKTEGTYRSMEGAPSHAKMNALMSTHSQPSSEDET